MKLECCECGHIHGSNTDYEYNNEGLPLCPGCGDVTDAYVLDENNNRLEAPDFNKED